MARDKTQPATSAATDERGDGTVGVDDFWSDDVLHTDENVQALGRIIDEEHDADAAEQATRSYMGAPLGPDERDELAAWAEAKACDECRDAFERADDVTAARHDDCRTALRAAGVLSRAG